jgi:type II secretory pathway pseudopilin PulG
VEPAIADVVAPRSHRAFSLLEMVFAGSILIIGLTSVAGVFGLMSTSFAHQKDMAIATTIAERFLEQVAILPQSSPILDDKPDPPRLYDATGRRVASPTEAKFSLQWEVTADTPVAGMKEILVDVSWQGTRLHHVVLFTYRE